MTTITEPSVCATGAGGQRIPLRPRKLGARPCPTGIASLSGRLTPGRDATVQLSNSGGHTGDADFYQWGLRDGNDGLEQNDLRAVGTQAWDFVEPFGRMVTFAINNWTRWDNNAVDEYDILIDTDDDGEFDHAVVGIDVGLVTAGLFNGQMASVTVNLETGDAFLWFLANYRFNNGVTLLHVPASAIGLSEGDGDFTYTAAAFSLRDVTGDDFIDGTAQFDAWQPAIDGAAAYTVVPAGGSAEAVVPVNASAFAQQQPLGIMVVSADDAAGEAEAALLERPGRSTRPRP